MTIKHQGNMLLRPGQHNLPSRERFIQMFEGIFERQYYTESGPLVQKLEELLIRRLEVEQVICTSNASIAWIMLLEAGLERRKIVMPATAPKALFEGSVWTNCETTICDVDATHDFRLSSLNFKSHLIEDVDCIIGVNRWGGAAMIDDLLQLPCDAKFKLFFDSSESFGSMFQERQIGSFGAAEVISFNSENILNGVGGACICTSDELLADRIRCMRSSGGVRKKVPITKTVNGRMSEAQAAYALMSLEALHDNIERNQQLHNIYEKELSSISGLRLISAAGASKSNYQQAVVVIDEQEYGISRSKLSQHLLANAVKTECIDLPMCDGLNDSLMADLPGFTALSNSAIELPLGSAVTPADIKGICNHLREFGR